MNKKIVGIIVCTLLISTATFSLAINVKKINNSSRDWSETQKIIAGDGASDDRFGCSVEIDGDSAIVGAYFDDVNSKLNAGSAYVFVKSGSTWTQQAKLTASDGDDGDEFGWSVSIDGDYAIIGAHKEAGSGNDRGAAYVFYRSGSTWTEQQKLTPGDSEDNDFFGKSVSIDGEYAIIGAPGKNSNQGFSYIFKRTGTSWAQMTKVGAGSSNKLGWSVSINLPFVLMGAWGSNSNTGAAHIYELVGSSWYGRGKLTASDGVSMDFFGYSVAINDDYAVCGAPGYSSAYRGGGASYIFKKPATGWTDMTETQKIIASDNEDGDEFGQSVSIDGDRMIIAAPHEDGAGNDRGAAYIFNRDGSSWSEDAKLNASDAQNDDYFGWGVSINDNSAIVGAYSEDNTNGNEAGASYLYEWSNQAPTPPVITGPTNGKAGTPYSYTFTSTDGDGDQVSYYVDWDDGTPPTWSAFQDSGVSYSASHTWSSDGTYIITAKAKDTNGDESSTTTYTVTIPRNKAINNQLLNWFQLHPNLFLILQKLMQGFGL